jgi:hypothetical protein
MNTTPSMTMERTDAASARRFEPKPATGSFQTVEPRIEVTAPLGERYDEILTPEALAFLAELHDRFAGTRHELLAARLQTRVEAGPPRPPHFHAQTHWLPESTRPTAATQSSCPRPSGSAATRRGGSPAPARDSRTDVSRSPVPPTGRWRSTR